MGDRIRNEMGNEMEKQKFPEMEPEMENEGIHNPLRNIDKLRDGNPFKVEKVLLDPESIAKRKDIIKNANSILDNIDPKVAGKLVSMRHDLKGAELDHKYRGIK